jgi:hypothetical protein
MENTMSTAIASIKLKEDWFEPLEYAPENVIVEVLEEDTDNTEVFMRDIGYSSDTTDIESFSIWADL